MAAKECTTTKMSGFAAVRRHHILGFCNKDDLAKYNHGAQAPSPVRVIEPSEPVGFSPNPPLTPLTPCFKGFGFSQSSLHSSASSVNPGSPNGPVLAGWGGAPC